MGIKSPTTLTTPREDLQGTFKQGPLDFEPSCLTWLRPLGVSKSKGSIDVLTPQSLLALPTRAERNKDGSFNFTESDRTSIEFELQAYGFNHAYDDEERADFEDLYGYEQSISRMLYARLMRKMEARALALVNTTNFATGTRGHSASNAWADVANADPAEDTTKARKGVYNRSGEIINAAVMSWTNIWDAWKCDKIWKNLKFTQGIGGAPDLNVLAAAMGIEMVIPWGGKYNAGKEGQAVSTSDLANTDYVFFCKIAKSDANDEVCIGRTLFHRGFGGLATAFSGRLDLNHVDVLQVYQKTQEALWWTDLGWLMLNAD